MAIVWHEVALGAVTCLFLSSRTCMGCVVAVNGVLCHGAMALNSKRKHAVRVLDVVCNLAMVGYTNTFAEAHPVVGVLTIVALVSWRANNRNAVGPTKAIVHAALVQLPMLVAHLHYAAVVV